MLEGVESIVKQIKTPIDVCHNSMPGVKYRRDDLRNAVKCCGCGKIGHMSKDNTAYYRTMRKKSKEYQKNKSQALKEKKTG